VPHALPATTASLTGAKDQTGPSSNTQMHEICYLAKKCTHALNVK